MNLNITGVAGVIEKRGSQLRISDFIPPILNGVIRKIWKKERLYASYEEALALCNDAYENSGLVQVVYEKTRRYRDRLATESPLVLDTVSINTYSGFNLVNTNSELNVIDYGGACGAHYFLIRRLFNTQIRFRWHVVETPAMADAGKNLENDELKFFDNLESAVSEMNDIDILFSSGALQYVAEPYEVLKSFINTKAKNIFLNRLSLTSLDKEIIMIQKSLLSKNGPGPMPEYLSDGIVRYPVTIPRKKRIEDILQSKYSVRILFADKKDLHSSNSTWIDALGYFCGLKSEDNRDMNKQESVADNPHTP